MQEMNHANQADPSEMGQIWRCWDGMYVIIYGRTIWCVSKNTHFLGSTDFQFLRCSLSENQHFRSEKKRKEHTGGNLLWKITTLVVDEIDVTGEFPTARFEYDTGIPHPQPAALARFVSHA